MTPTAPGRQGQRLHGQRDLSFRFWTLWGLRGGLPAVKAAQWLTGSPFLLLTTHKGPDGGRVLGSGSGSSGRRQPHTDTQ